MTLSQSDVDAKCLELGNSLLKPFYRKDWKESKPTWGYCYIISEALYHYVYPDTQSYIVNFNEIEGMKGVHWFLIDSNHNIIDFTANQFKFKVPYGVAKRAHFFQGSIVAPRGLISKRGYEMAKHLGVVTDA